MERGHPSTPNLSQSSISRMCVLPCTTVYPGIQGCPACSSTPLLMEVPDAYHVSCRSCQHAGWAVVGALCPIPAQVNVEAVLDLLPGSCFYTPIANISKNPKHHVYRKCFKARSPEMNSITKLKILRSISLTCFSQNRTRSTPSGTWLKHEIKRNQLVSLATIDSNLTRPEQIRCGT